MRITTLCSTLVTTAMAIAQNPVTINLEPFATGLSSPVDIAHCGDERLFVVEQAGKIKILSADGVVSARPFLDIEDRVNDNGGEQGMLGLAFDPHYQTNGRFYVYYIFGDGNGTSRVSRFTVSADPDSADVESEEILYTVSQPATNHNGGDMDFGPDGHLYIGFGDGGSGNDPWNNGQDLRTPLGDMIRLDVSGESGYTIPPTNPWVGLATDTLPEIWASGLRNPWRFGFDRQTGDLWIGDVGQNQREEVNFLPAGDHSGPNFGWRCYEGDIATPGIDDDCPPAASFVGPVSVHPHSAGWCSVIGGRVYRGSEFPRLFGRYIYTDYCPTPYFSLHPDGAGGWVREQVRANNGGTGTSAIAENSAGELFVANVNTGTIRRIVDQCPMDAPTISQSNGVLTSTSANSYAWYLNGEVIPGATSQTFVPMEEGNYHVAGTYAGGCTLVSNTIQVVSTGIQSGQVRTFMASPVPAHDRLILEGVPAGVAQVEFVDSTGKVVVRNAWKSAEQGSLSVADLANGMYMLRLVDKQGRIQQQRSIQVQH